MFLQAIASGVESYQAFDPNINLRKGHGDIIKRFVPAHLQHNFKVTYAPAEQAELPDGQTFDLIFTSPPFFDFEIYTDAPGQSVEKFSEVTSWLTGFLFVCLKKFWARLEDDGHVALHMS